MLWASPSGAVGNYGRCDRRRGDLRSSPTIYSSACGASGREQPMTLTKGLSGRASEHAADTTPQQSSPLSLPGRKGPKPYSMVSTPSPHSSCRSMCSGSGECRGGLRTGRDRARERCLPPLLGSRRVVREYAAIRCCTPAPGLRADAADWAGHLKGTAGLEPRSDARAPATTMSRSSSQNLFHGC
jgi:hypothetical protein